MSYECPYCLGALIEQDAEYSFWGYDKKGNRVIWHAFYCPKCDEHIHCSKEETQP